MQDPAAELLAVSLPAVSVIVCTRNRTEDIAKCVESILANNGPRFELVVVDQSDGSGTEEVLRPHGNEPRFRYVRTATRGLSHARNVGITASLAPVLAFTDDDCRVDPDWVAKLEAIFESEPDVGLVFGRVSLPDGTAEIGHAASFEPRQRFYQHTFPAASGEWGIGANMAVRRTILAEVGSFDPLLGAGARFPAGEELDLAIRVLAAGHKVVNAGEACVLHLGVRKGLDASKLARSYGLGTGAALAKHARLGTRRTRGLLLGWVAQHATQTAKNVALGQRPSGLGYFLAFVSGIFSSYAYSVDVETSVYADRASRQH